MAVLKILMLLMPFIGSVLAVIYFITFDAVYSYLLSTVMLFYITIILYFVSYQSFKYGIDSELEAALELGELLRTIVFFLLSALVFLNSTIINLGGS